MFLVIHYVLNEYPGFKCPISSTLNKTVFFFLNVNIHKHGMSFDLVG